MLAFLAWWILAGPVFVTPSADAMTKGCLVLVAAFTLLDIVLIARRLPSRVVAPAAESGR